MIEEEVRHIAELAKLNIKDEDIDKYGKQLKDILGEIEKINEAKIEGDIMISPTDQKNVYFNDTIENHISKKDAFKNAKRVKGDFIIVPKVIE